LAEKLVEAIETVFRQEHGRVLATLINVLGSFEAAEDALQDALVTAIQQWQVEGIPNNPAAWLTTVARRRTIDKLRRDSTAARKHAILGTLAETQSVTSVEAEAEVNMNGIPDERLKLMFTCCHPSLALEAQVALTLHTLGGLSTPEIARAFLVSEPTMAQRLARARVKIRDAGIPYSIPSADQLPERISALLAVIYLIFNEGYCATSGDSLTRHELCGEAIRLCRALIELLPGRVVAEAWGLLALMLLHDSRRLARVDDADELVLLEDQDRSLWNQAQITEAVAIITHVLHLRNFGPYQIQAAISAVHAESPTYAETDWQQIVALYRILIDMTPTPVVQLNYAVAVSMIEGAVAGLNLILPLQRELASYYPYHVARADMLRRTNQREAAADGYEEAIALCQNSHEWAFLQRRLDQINGR
jgi:RNA polymerase sigma-70 factor, ECF subfamily